MLELHLQYKRTSWLTNTIKETLSSLLDQGCSPSISYFSLDTSLDFSFLVFFVLLGKNVLGVGEWRRKTFTQ